MLAKVIKMNLACGKLSLCLKFCNTCASVKLKRHFVNVNTGNKVSYFAMMHYDDKDKNHTKNYTALSGKNC